MKRGWSGFRARVNEPLIADRSLDLMVMILWAIYGTWGITSTLAKIPTLDKVANPVYAIGWGAAIGVTAWVAAIAATSVFFSRNHCLKARIRKKQGEMWAVCILAGLVSVYPALLLIQGFVQGDTARQPLAVLALSYLAVPTWRAFHLTKRIRALRVQLLAAQIRAQHRR